MVTEFDKCKCGHILKKHAQPIGMPPGRCGECSTCMQFISRS